MQSHYCDSVGKICGDEEEGRMDTSIGTTRPNPPNHPTGAKYWDEQAEPPSGRRTMDKPIPESSSDEPKTPAVTSCLTTCRVVCAWVGPENRFEVTMAGSCRPSGSHC
ncbi:hypothetical protein AVEN_147552-1 [Araneus ventricosus]|uniref:Uncharacterized protein n=1 Tax=Araneus ventricosus TaxID=182803 RepID=A0A4Y2VEB1_ARAVE|nr:hypothetical protein AVEN_147552-1 [Araneus ventricosus]